MWLGGVDGKKPAGEAAGMHPVAFKLHGATPLAGEMHGRRPPVQTGGLRSAGHRVGPLGRLQGKNFTN